jgi:type II secretory ATPase GspE/PulE/Tfp pilus assembly ATPase PilB-like protein
MDIAERRLPQDGRCTVRIKDRIVDLRISVAPFVMGEKCVIRILEQKQSFVKLENLGFSGDSFGKFTDMIDKPYGMVLVTGPTGSGKSTTLYAALNELNTGTKNISTIEDPVEYQIDGLNQMQILPRIELTFSAALRSFLRQDPDIIMVGEVRDRETAEIAVQAALTGHLVLSTIHTKNTVGALVRLIDMGIPPFLVASSVNGIVSQRLLRRLCPRCTSELDVTPEMEKTLSASPYPITKFRRGKGCEMCKGTGYYGRTAIYEVLKVSQRLSRAVRANADSSALLEIAREEGLVTLNEAAWEKVRDGVTSPEEVLRMTLCLEDSA